MVSSVVLLVLCSFIGFDNDILNICLSIVVCIDYVDLLIMCVYGGVF